MVQRFFHTLIIFWLPHKNHEVVCREAINFYYWLLKLKAVAFLPGTKLTSQRWRIRQVKKCINKMPPISIEFFKAMDALESYYNPASFSYHDFQFLSIKRANVGSLLNFIKQLEQEKDIPILQSMLLDVSSTSKFFKLKKNKRK